MHLTPNLPAISLYNTLPSFWGSPFQQEVSEMISGARSVAVNVLGATSEKERRMYLHKSSHQHRKQKFKAHKMLFVYGADEGAGFGLRWIVGVASFLFGNLSAPLTGGDLAIRRFAVSELTRVDEELAGLGSYSQYQRRDTVAKALAEMLFHERKIFLILKRNAETALFFRIILIITAVMGFLGALGIADLILTGAVGMFGTGCIMLVKTGLDSTALQVRREAEELRRYVDYLLGASWLTGTARGHYPSPAIRV